MASSKAKQLKIENSKLVKKLVTSVTGLKQDEDSENFQIAVRYVNSVFANRPFRDFCPADVWKRVTRITERFEHQAEHRKAKIWISLTSALKSKANSLDEDSLTAVLFVLMDLSNLRTRLPLDKNFDCVLQVSEPNVAASSDFQNAFEADAKCLLPAYESDSEYESSTCSEESNEPMCLGAVSADSGAGNSPELELVPVFPPQVPDETDHQYFDPDPLQYDLITPYWIQLVQGPKSVSEQALMTETIWMLLGNKNVFLFQWNGSRFYVREGTHLIDLSQESLEAVLSHVCECAQYFVEVQEYCEKFSNLKVPRILQAFVLALRQSTQVVTKRLIILEKEATDEDSSLTLLLLLDKLRPTLSLIVTLYSVLQMGIVQKPVMALTPCGQSLHLLTSLYKAAVEEDKIYGRSRSHFTILVNVFLDTCQPFLNFVDHLLTEGQIEDPHEEFIIERLTDVTSLNCDNVLVFREVSSRFRDGFFLCEVLKEVVLASCLTVMLKESAQWVPAPNCPSESLSAQYANLCRKKLKVPSEIREEFPLHPPTTGPPKKSTDLSMITDFLSKFDPLLKKNFAQIFPFPSADRECKKENAEIQEPQPLTDFGEPLSLLLEDTLSSLVTKKCEVIHRKVMGVLKGDLFIPDHLLVIRKYFLLEYGDAINMIMKKIVRMVMKKNLISSAKQVVRLFDQTTSESKLKNVELLTLTIELQSNKTSSTEPLDDFHTFCLGYTAPSPVNLILCNKNMAIYQDIFRFLMKLHCAKTSLDMLRFNDLGDKEVLSDSLKTQSMYIFIFRMHLLHIINKLHFYFLTGLLQSRQSSLATALDGASSFHQILCLHQDHVEDMQQFCLLSPPLLLFNRIICNILNLVVSFSSAWNTRTLISGIKKVEVFENDFHRHIWAFNRTSSLFLSQQVSKVCFKQFQFSEFVTLCSIFSSQTLIPRPILFVPNSS